MEGSEWARYYGQLRVLAMCLLNVRHTSSSYTGHIAAHTTHSFAYPLKLTHVLSHSMFTQRSLILTKRLQCVPGTAIVKSQHDVN